jgi:RNA-directed DNA polymerase
MQGPLVSFQSPEELRSALWPAVWPPAAFPDRDPDLFQKLADKGLPPLVSIRAMGLILGVNPKLITAMARFPKGNYRAFMMPKRSGGERMILAPRVFLKTVQRYILQAILEAQPLPAYVNGFVPGRSIVTNAQAHKGAKYVLNVDILNFFDSVREEAIGRIFSDLGFGPHVASTLARLCTYQDCLPQGAPTSPYLANLVFSPADKEILQLCEERRIAYSRYADDLSFSGSQKIARDFLVLLEFVLRRYGFRLNPGKTRFFGPGQAHHVTGLVVNEKIHPKRALRRRLRAKFHNAALNPDDFHEPASTLLGWASFVNSYDRNLGSEYLAAARRVSRSQGSQESERQ